MVDRSENYEQIKFMQWCKRNQENYSELKVIFAIPNGGKRHIATASRLKLEGVKSGVPDLFLPVARHNKHGLFIEMKKEKGGVLSKNQKKWRDLLKHEGYAWVRANGYKDAILWVKKYLGI